jgi:hypothetical protein
MKYCNLDSKSYTNIPRNKEIVSYWSNLEMKYEILGIIKILRIEEKIDQESVNYDSYIRWNQERMLEEGR